jgi:catechol 2,3-dioxygenase-like lactoylglutathione lyase family enzyme
MALKNVIGIDHAVVMVKDLEKAADNYRQLGFTLSPRGTHSAHMGTGNYTIMFDPDYRAPRIIGCRFVLCESRS